MQTNPKVDLYLNRVIPEAFDRIEDSRDVPPSEIEKYLDRAWGLGEMWRDWWMESGEEYY